MNPPLERLAGRVADDPFFLASALARYAQGEGLDDTGLAARLGCQLSALTPLRLCRLPRSEAPFFWQDVERIATRFGINVQTLAEVVRRGQSLLHLQDPEQNPQHESAGFLLAARDRPAESPRPSQGESP